MQNQTQFVFTNDISKNMGIFTASELIHLYNQFLFIFEKLFIENFAFNSYLYLFCFNSYQNSAISLVQVRFNYILDYNSIAPRNKTKH